MPSATSPTPAKLRSTLGYGFVALSTAESRSEKDDGPNKLDHPEKAL